ncbi:hypothetical protein [Mailhella massiliensis]|uniref:hypothetical protein n=1 Tax=Mailhella massiliensis TaxID=1903261 RepID=UPI00097D3402|nr:hypothetical protein [Mailhella massiliensis]
MNWQDNYDTEEKKQKLCVETTIGKELVDIVTILQSLGAEKNVIIAAVLGRSGICSSAWPQREVQH